MFQKVEIIGNLGADPEMRFTPNGVAVTNFNVATAEKINKEGHPECPAGWKESYNGKYWEITTWFRVTVWRGQAEACNQYLKKGSQVFVEGKVNGESNNGVQNPRVWQGKDGVSRASFELTARNVKFLGGGNGGGGDRPVEDEPPGYVEESDIPF